MTSKETKSEAILRDLRDHKGEKPASKRKRFSRLIVIFDALIILIILFIIANRRDSSEIYTSRINVKSTEIVYTITEIPETKKIIFSLTIKGAGKGYTKIPIRENLAELFISDGGNIIIKQDIAAGIKSLEIADDEVRIFTSDIDKKLLNDYLKNEKNYRPGKRSIIDFGSRSYKFSSEVRINYPDPVTIPLDFKYEVSND